MLVAAKPSVAKWPTGIGAGTMPWPGGDPETSGIRVGIAGFR